MKIHYLKQHLLGDEQEQAIANALENWQIMTSQERTAFIDSMSVYTNPDWLETRAGKFTASTACAFLSDPAKKEDKESGKIGDSAKELCYKVMAEQTGWREPTNPYMEFAQVRRGLVFEDTARKLAAEQLGEEITQCGFVESDVMFGCSPDGLIIHDGKIDAVVEIKCLTDDGEILTNRGFIPIKKVTTTDKVAQYTRDGQIKFVTPNFVLHKSYDGDIYKFYRYNKLTMSLTANHRIIYFDRKHNLCECLAKDFNGSKKTIAVGGLVKGNSGLTADQRFKIAVNADGNINGNIIRFEFSRKRKINRLIGLLQILKYDYQIKDGRKFDNRKWKPTTYITVKIKNARAYKQGLSSIIDIDKCSTKKAIDFIYELSQWDGTIGSSQTINYTSKNRNDVDFVSALCVLANKKSNICKQNNCWLITISGFGKQSKTREQVLSFYNKKSSGQYIKKEHYTGMVHCVSVDSGMFVARFGNSCPFITGNCPEPKAFYKQLMDCAKREYQLQMQFAMWVCDCPRAYFVLYCPEVSPKVFVIKYTRGMMWQNKLEKRKAQVADYIHEVNQQINSGEFNIPTME